MPKEIITRKIIAILLFIAALFSLNGCHFSKDSVELASKSEILEYAQQKFGESTYLSTSKGDDSIEYSLRDNQYGFEYTIKSFVQPYGMDGSVFGYSEEKSSDFESIYCNYICAELSEFISKNEKELNVEFQRAKYVSYEYFGDVLVGEDVDIEAAIKFVENMANQITGIDDRGYFSNSEIDLKYRDGEELIGSYIFKETKFKTDEELSIDFYMDRARQMLKSDVEYQRLETVKRSDVFGLSEFQIVSMPNTANDTKEYVNCYYFVSNNKEYFIADVVIEDGSSIRQHVYCITDNCSFSNNRYD